MGAQDDLTPYERALVQRLQRDALKSEVARPRVADSLFLRVLYTLGGAGFLAIAFLKWGRLFLNLYS